MAHVRNLCHLYQQPCALHGYGSYSPSRENLSPGVTSREALNSKFGCHFVKVPVVKKRSYHLAGVIGIDLHEELGLLYSVRGGRTCLALR